MRDAVERPKISCPSLKDVRDYIDFTMKVYDVGFLKALQIWLWPKTGYPDLLKQVRWIVAKDFESGLQRSFAVSVLTVFLHEHIPGSEAQFLALRLIDQLSGIEDVATEKEDHLVKTIENLLEVYMTDAGMANLAINAICPNLFCLIRLRAVLITKYFGDSIGAQEYQRMAITLLGESSLQYSLREYGSADLRSSARDRLDFAYNLLLKAQTLLLGVGIDPKARDSERVFIRALLEQIKVVDLKITNQWNLPAKEWPES